MVSNNLTHLLLVKPQISLHILELVLLAAPVSKTDDGVTATRPLHRIHTAAIKPRDVAAASSATLDLADNGEHWPMRLGGLSIPIAASGPVRLLNRYLAKRAECAVSPVVATVTAMMSSSVWHGGMCS